MVMKREGDDEEEKDVKDDEADDDKTCWKWRDWDKFWAGESGVHDEMVMTMIMMIMMIMMTMIMIIMMIMMSMMFWREKACSWGGWQSKIFQWQQEAIICNNEKCVWRER